MKKHEPNRKHTWKNMNTNETSMRTGWKENEAKRAVKTRQKHRHNNANKQAKTIDKNMADQAKIIEKSAKKQAKS